MPDSVIEPDGYASAATGAMLVIVNALANDGELQDLDALDLWERLDPLVPPALPVDPGVTFMQWSVAFNVARAELGLAPRPCHTEIALIGPMADANVRTAARVLLGGRFVDHGAAWCFHCKCGWVSDGRGTVDLLGSEISWHLLDAHR